MNYSLTKLLGLLLLGVVTTAAYATAPAQIPQTGQTANVPTGCSPISSTCIASPSGSDGALQKGTVGTNASSRFAAGTGAEADCITDTQTGLMWPKNGIIGFEASQGGGPISQPNYANTDVNLNNLTWTQALTAVANMNGAGTKLCGHSDWRLPNRNELRSLVNYGQPSVANWLIAQGFSNVQADNYWSSTTYALYTSYAWYVRMLDGVVGNDDLANYYYVWPVRGGQ